jgi:hypothetical protein
MRGHENLQWNRRVFCSERMKETNQAMRLKAVFDLIHQGKRGCFSSGALEAGDKQA